MNNIFKICLSVFVVSFFLTGCANVAGKASPKEDTSQQITIDTKNKKAKVIVLPAMDLDKNVFSKSTIESKLLKKFIKLYRYPQNRNKSKNIIFDIWTITYNDFKSSMDKNAIYGTYKKVKLSKTLTIGGYIRQTNYIPTTLSFKIPYSIQRKGDKYIITLTPPSKAVYNNVTGEPLADTMENLKKDILRMYDSIKDITLHSTHTLHDEINSKYHKDSIYGNFKRKTREIKNNDTYDIDLNKNTYRITLEVFPYRNGSKIIYSVVMPYVITKNGYSLSDKTISILKNKILSIIND